MIEGHDGDSYRGRALLTGIYNRLGDGKVKPIECEPPAWMKPTPQKITSAKEEIELARSAFKQWLGERGNHA